MWLKSHIIIGSGTRADELCWIPNGLLLEIICITSKAAIAA
jgi:hypothetical protein